MILASWYHPILATIFAFMAVVLMGVILLQRGRGVGLAGAFGGVGGHTAFGAKTGDFLTWATIVIASVFLCYVVVLNYVFVPLKAAGAAAPPPALPTPLPAPAAGTGDQPTPAADEPVERPIEGPPTEEAPVAPAEPTFPTPDDEAPTEPPARPPG
jgi:preprotein translocase subunit SecG